MKVEEIITNRIMEALRQGTVPWRKPWHLNGVPHNMVSKKPYRGINFFLLSLLNYSDPRFLTYNQASAKGWKVKSGKAIPVIFFKFIQTDKLDDNGKPIKFPMLRYYNVWNVSDVEGDIPQYQTMQSPIAPIERCEQVVSNMPNCPEIVWGGNAASYSRMTDTVKMPGKTQFHSSEELYATLFHELVHSTMHENRLNRTTNKRTDETYSFEELVAEMGSSFLCGYCGIENKTIDNAASYIANWLKHLSDDPKMVIFAGSKAQKAFDYIMGVQDNEADETSNKTNDELATA